MTPSELDELIADCPVLYHMAERGSWPSIKERGLLSTSALLDLYEIEGDDRATIESMRRPQGVSLVHPDLPRAVVRDQIPIADGGLMRCLPKHVSPADWYRILNSKVFFWLTRERLLTLLNAGAYKNSSHDVLEVETRSLVEAYREKIWLCPMNSGCTKPFPHPRDENTFRRISDYPYADRRKKKKVGERVVELAVDYGVPDIERFVLRVIEMKQEKQRRIVLKK